ncbi:MAG: hypothetical protein GY805_10755 [Chloroflexi bacterium]|nr:hypothetical protein [Chloroflexota bacterium]
MMRNWFKRLLWSSLIIAGIIAVYQFASIWLEYKLMYPSENQLVQVNSPDGEQIACFSVKYEGNHSWWPDNPKPHFYITVVEPESGKVLLRETDFDWPETQPYRSTDDSFASLAQTYATWADFQQPEIIPIAPTFFIPWAESPCR